MGSEFDSSTVAELAAQGEALKRKAEEIAKRIDEAKRNESMLQLAKTKNNQAEQDAKAAEELTNILKNN